MKRILTYTLLIFTIAQFLFGSGCKKEEIPTATLTTSTITNITVTSASSGGNITDDGGSTVTVRGVCWSTGTTPTTADSKTTNGAGAGTFTSSITGLTTGTIYYVRAYATNASGTGYGMAMSFTTQPATTPVLTTANVTTITRNTATCGGTITSDGASPITSRGVCWSTTQNPTTLDSKTSDASGIGIFTSSLTGLIGNTTYYLRAFATNSIGTGYGSEVSFTTQSPTLPILTTTNVTNIIVTTATSGGNITNDGGAIVTVRGTCWSTNPNPTIANSKTTDGSGTGSFVSNLTGLQPGTIYYIKSYATNSVGTVYGNEISFTITATIPTLTTTAVSSVSGNTAISGGNVISDGGEIVTARSVCWSTTADPSRGNIITTDGTGTGEFTSSISGLTPNTTYYLRAYAINSVGTSYGNLVSFTTQINPIIFNPNLTYGTVIDVEGNVYKTIAIGTQTWMAEDLKTTKYADGTAITFINTHDTWVVLTTTDKAYCWYDDKIKNKEVFGALYTWAAAMNGAETSYTDPSGVRGVCPTGWHLPSFAEWGKIITYLDGSLIAGDKMKEIGTTHWLSPNTGATNESGFTALPDGSRTKYGFFGKIGTGGDWWSSSRYNDIGESYAWGIRNFFSGVDDWTSSVTEGHSVRCVKD